MRGELIAVWPCTWRDVWTKLAKHPAAPRDLFGELYRELSSVLDEPTDAQRLAEIVDDPRLARVAFRRITARQICGERALVRFFENAFDTIQDLGGEELGDRYFALTESLLQRYSLRYDLRPPFNLNPTLAGVFAKLMQELRATAKDDAHLADLMRDFEAAVRALRDGGHNGELKTCIQKENEPTRSARSLVPRCHEKHLGSDL